MQALRTVIQGLSTRHGQIISHIRRSSGSSSFPELAFFDDLDDMEPEDEEGVMNHQYPILHSRHSDLFYMPNCVGPAYQGLISSLDQPYTTDCYMADEQTLVKENDSIHDTILESLVAPTEMCVVACPKLLLTYMRRLFQHPYARFGSSMNFSMIGLRFKDKDATKALTSFVHFASYNSREIMDNGYWADFINPLTGRAYYRAAHCIRKQGLEAQLLGRGLNLTFANGCTIIGEEQSDQLTGFIFTDTPCKVLESWFS